MKHMGGLRKLMPVTAWTFILGSAALAGIFPLAGFWSKDAVLTTAINENPALFGIGLVVAFMTAAYMGRAFILTFLGEYRGGGAGHHAEPDVHAAPAAHAAHDAHASGHDAHDAGHGAHAAAATHDAGHHEPHGEPHESPAAMTIPLGVLAVLSVVVGFFSLPKGFPGVPHPGMIDHLLVGEHAPAWFPGIHEDEFSWLVAGGGTLAAIIGMFVAWNFYGSRAWSIDSFVAKIGPVHRWVENKFYFDDVYLWLVRQVQQRVADFCAWFEKHILVETVVGGVSAFTKWLGYLVRLLLDGHLHRYVTLALFGIVAVLAYLGMRN